MTGGARSLPPSTSGALPCEFYAMSHVDNWLCDLSFFISSICLIDLPSSMLVSCLRHMTCENSNNYFGNTSTPNNTITTYSAFFLILHKTTRSSAKKNWKLEQNRMVCIITAIIIDRRVVVEERNALFHFGCCGAYHRHTQHHCFASE